MTERERERERLAGLEGAHCHMGRRSQDREQWEDFKNKWSLIDSQQKHGNLGPAVAAAAKSPQSCPTLCDPIDGSPPGSSVPGTLQARILEWVTISFSVGMLRGYQNQEKAG